MTDREHLIAAIVRQPDDDTARLVYADWLDEQGGEGDAARAEFIRLGCELEQLYPGEIGPTNVSIYHVRKRMRTLLKDYYMSWGLDIPGPWTPHGFKCEGEIFLSTGDNSSLCRVKLSRGFVSEIHLPCAAYKQSGFAKQLFSSQPVTKVTLTDVMPAVYTGSLRTVYFWVDGEHDQLEPYRIDPDWWLWLDRWNTVPANRDSSDRDGWETPEESRANLSDALVQWGREQAGLPILELSPIHERK